MATSVQRWSALCEALLGKPATPAQMLHLGQSLSASIGVLGPGQFDLMTNTQKADYCIRHARKHFIQLVIDYDVQAAAAAAIAAVPDPNIEFADTP